MKGLEYLRRKRAESFGEELSLSKHGALLSACWLRTARWAKGGWRGRWLGKAQVSHDQFGSRQEDSSSWISLQEVTARSNSSGGRDRVSVACGRLGPAEPELRMWHLSLRVRSTHCKDMSHSCRQRTGRCHAGRAREGAAGKGPAGGCAGWTGAAEAAGKGAELRGASGKSPDKDRSMLERRKRHVYAFGSDDHQRKGLDVSLGPSAASHPRDIKLAGRRCRVRRCGG